MHTYCLSFLKVSAEAAFMSWPDGTKQKLDILVKKLIQSSSSSIAAEIPRYPVDRDIMNLTLVTTNQWVDFWFLILIISCAPKGELILIDAFDFYYKNIKIEASIKISDITSKYGNIKSNNDCKTPTQHFDFS